MKSILQTISVAAITLAQTTAAALSTFTPLSSSSPEYTIGIPSSSSISSTSPGALYIQIKAPSSYQWVGFGIGEQMANARIFVMYADGDGNVTISARDGGQGHVVPQWDEGMQKGVSILEGTGIVDGEMVGRFRCDSATLSSSKTSTSSPFIAAWMGGNPLNTTSLEVSLRQHSGNAYRQFTFDLSTSSLSSDTNPFSSSPSRNSSSNGDDDDDSRGSNNKNNGGATVVGTSGDTLAKFQKAHGVTMSIAVVLLLPAGAIYMRLGGGIWGHAGLQFLSLAVLIAGFGLGVHLGNISNLLYTNTHTILGTVIFALLLLQPFLGYAHHHFFVRKQSRTHVSHIHIWLGRLALALGLVNGGLGLSLADNTTGGKIAYAVVAGVVGVVYAVLVVWKRKGGEKRGGAVVDGVNGRKEER